MKPNEYAVNRCREKIYEALVSSPRTRLLRIKNVYMAEIASESVDWATSGYEGNIVGDELRRYVRERFAKKYGSIWTILLFTLVWELIKKYLFETK